MDTGLHDKLRLKELLFANFYWIFRQSFLQVPMVIGNFLFWQYFAKHQWFPPQWEMEFVPEDILIEWQGSPKSKKCIISKKKSVKTIHFLFLFVFFFSKGSPFEKFSSLWWKRLIRIALIFVSNFFNHRYVMDLQNLHFCHLQNQDFTAFLQ